MTASKFKAGDIVVPTAEGIRQWPKTAGHVFKVVVEQLDRIAGEAITPGFSGHTCQGYVSWGKGFWFRPDEVELQVKDGPVKGYIVCLTKDGGFLPATKPFIHPNMTAAQLEADRLSKLHGGRFTVLEAVYAVNTKIETSTASEYL